MNEVPEFIALLLRAEEMVVNQLMAKYGENDGMRAHYVELPNGQCFYVPRG